jgi:hypothetical protein
MIIKAEQPQKYFLIIHEGLEKAMSHSGGYVTVGQIHQALRENVWWLYMVLDDDGDYVGFGIAEPLALANGTWLNIPFAYAKDGLYDEFFFHMREVALDNGMVGIKFVSSRPGFEKIAKRNGWKPGFVEYIVEDFRGR